MSWKPDGDAQGARPRIAQEIRHPHRRAHPLLRVPPMTARPAPPRFDLERIRAVTGGGSKRFWSSLEELIDEEGFRDWLAGGIPRRVVDVRRSRPPPVPQADGRVAAARRADRVQRTDPLRPGAALRQPARPDRAGRRAVLRHRGAVRRLRPAGDRHDLCRPPDQARRQSRSSGHRRRKRRVHAVGDLRAVRSRAFEDSRARWRAVDLGHLQQRVAPSARALARAAGRRPAHPHRRHLIADADPPDAGAGQAISEDALAPVRAGRHGGAGRGDGARLRPRGHAASSGSTTATSSSASITICSGRGRIRSPHAAAWAKRRGEIAPGQGRARLHVAECVPSLTGTVASTRLPCDASRLPLLAQAIGAQFALAGFAMPELREPERKWVDRAVGELRAHPGHSLLAIGPQLDPQWQALAPLINDKLEQHRRHGLVQRACSARQAIETQSLTALVADMAASAVDTLVMIDCNPAYTSAGALDFAKRLALVRNRIHAGLHADETAQLCQWHLPLSHPLESFGDARAVDGSASIIQPVVAPLYSSRSVHQFVDMLLGTTDPAADGAVRATWQATFGGDFEQRWVRALHDGFVADSAAQAAHVVGQGRPAARWRTPQARRRHRHRVPARSDDLGRPLRQHRVAAGIAEAAHQDHLGQCDRGQPGDRRRAGAFERRYRRGRDRRPAGARPGLDRPRPGAADRRADVRLRPPRRRRHRDRQRLRRLRRSSPTSTPSSRAAASSARAASSRSPPRRPITAWTASTSCAR